MCFEKMVEREATLGGRRRGRRQVPLTLFQDHVFTVSDFCQTPQRPSGRQTGIGFYIWKQLERPLISPVR